MHKVQKYSIYYIFVTLMHPCIIKALISFKAFADPKPLNSSIYISFYKLDIYLSILATYLTGTLNVLTVQLAHSRDGRIAWEKIHY